MHDGVFARASAGSAVLAPVAHAIIAVSLEAGGSRVVAPTAAGLPLAPYPALTRSFV